MDTPSAHTQVLELITLIDKAITCSYLSGRWVSLYILGSYHYYYQGHSGGCSNAVEEVLMCLWRL